MAGTDWDSAREKADYDNAQIEHHADSTPPGSESGGMLSAWSADEQRRIMRKVDYRLIPVCGVMYCVSLLDRTNLSNATIAGSVNYSSDIFWEIN